jgi:hypothetical protein
VRACPVQQGFGLQGPLKSEQDTAASAFGTKIVVTIGKARAATPIFRMAARRASRASVCSCFTSNLDFHNFRKVIHTSSSSTGDFKSFSIARAIFATFLFPSQSFHTIAALRFKQWALWFFSWYTRVSSSSSTTMPGWWTGTKFDASFHGYLRIIIGRG